MNIFAIIYTKNILFIICRNKHIKIVSQNKNFLKGNKLVAIVLPLKKKQNKLKLIQNNEFFMEEWISSVGITLEEEKKWNKN